MAVIEVKPINPSNPSFGANIYNVDVENLTNAEFEIIRSALYKYSVVCLKSQQDLTPKAQADLTRRFDPAAKGSYGHGKTLDAKRSVLHPDLKTVPHQPEVQVIGNGSFESYEGLENITLKHPHHRTFHRSVIPADKDYSHTRFYRWHIDAALYGALNPPLVTSLLAVQLAKPRTQTLLYDDGTNDTLQVPLGTTAFASSFTTFDLLTPTQKEFALTSKIEYAPHPYIWMSPAKSHPTGLGMLSEDLELPVSQLPSSPINPEEKTIQTLPMVWINPVTNKPALQIHPSCIRKIHLQDGSVIDDLAEVRRIVYEMQRPGIAPERVYAHDWQEGDLVLFDNHGVLHSVVGAFAEGEKRLFRQCNIAASRAPLGPEHIPLDTVTESAIPATTLQQITVEA